MGVKYEVVAVTGKYTDKNGTEKKRYMKCGVILESDKGLSLKLEAVPVGSDGWFGLYEPKARDDQPSRPQTAKPDNGADEEDFPF